MSKPTLFRRVLTMLVLAMLAIAPCAAAEDFSRLRARPVPDWLRSAVIYEVFPRNFSPEGNFNGITARLDELKDLGVKVLWLMPIHPIGEKFRKGSVGSPYAVRDFYAINPDYGTAADFKRLVREAHRRDLKVIIDLVANHTAWDSVMMAHPEFYKQNDKGEIIPPVPEWTDVAGLNYDNAGLRRYMIDMLKHWIDPAGFDLDGFRCDVAHMVPVSFWNEAREALAMVKPDLLMLAEASKEELLVKAFDLDYAWPFHGALNQVLLHGAPAAELRNAWEETHRKYPQGALHLRFSDNHDESRAVARFGIHGALAASAMMFLLDGVPLLYNGMEAGDATESGDPALFERLPVFWRPKDRPPLRDIYRDLARLRRQHPALTNERVIWLRNSEEDSLVTFMRLDDQDEFVVTINLSNRPVVGWVEVMHGHQFQPVKIAGLPEPPAVPLPLFRLNGFEWRVFHRPVR